MVVAWGFLTFLPIVVMIASFRKLGLGSMIFIQLVQLVYYCLHWVFSGFSVRSASVSAFSVRSQLDRSVHSVILSNFSVRFLSDHQFFSWFSISISSASLSVTSILVNGPLHKHYECIRSCRYFNAIFWQQIFDPLQLHLPFHHDSYLVTWGFLA